MNSNEHGKYKIKLDKNILLTDAIGPFNKELIERYNRELTDVIESITYKKWGQIIVLHEMSLFTPEAEIEFRKTLEFRKQKGLEVICIITSSCERSKLVQWQFSHIYSECGITYSIVDSYDDAKSFMIFELGN